MKQIPERRYRAKPALRAEIARQGRRADWFASQIGVQPSYLSKVFGGYRRLSEVQARIAAGVLGVDFFVLFEHPIGSNNASDMREVIRA